MTGAQNHYCQNGNQYARENGELKTQKERLLFKALTCLTSLSSILATSFEGSVGIVIDCNVYFLKPAIKILDHADSLMPTLNLRQYIGSGASLGMHITACIGKVLKVLAVFLIWEQA